MLGIVRKGFQTTGFVVTSTGVIPFTIQPFFCKWLLLLSEGLIPLCPIFAPILSSPSLPPHPQCQTLPKLLPSRNRQHLPSPPRGKSGSTSVCICRHSFTYYCSLIIALKAPNTRSSTSLVKAPMGSCALPCIDQVVARSLSRRSPLSTIQCSACGPFESLSSSSS